MSIVLIDTDAFSQIMEKLDAIEEKISKSTNKPEKLWMDNEQLCSYLNISSRTLQNYRDSGTIAFSQYGSKIWYRFQDVQAFLERNRKVESKP